MGRVIIRAAKIHQGRIERLRVQLGALPPREIDREVAIAWMKDGHSLLPVEGDRPGRALHLVEGEGGWFVRDDAQAVAADALPAGVPALD